MESLAHLSLADEKWENSGITESNGQKRGVIFFSAD